MRTAPLRKSPWPRGRRGEPFRASGWSRSFEIRNGGEQVNGPFELVLPIAQIGTQGDQGNGASVFTHQ